MKTTRRLPTGFLILSLSLPTPPGYANPVGEVVVAGQAAFHRSQPGQLIINQGSPRAIINWADFSIGRGESTRFVMPSSSASVLNRVVGVNPSQLFGTLQANGHVFIINPNGIFIGQGGVVNTRSLTASTLDVPDAAYLAGAGLRFSGNSMATVRNDGSIRALGGDVFLIGHRVENTGSIEARQGTVGLAAGSEVILQPAGNDRLSVVAGNTGASTGGQGIHNAGSIEAVAAELKAAGGNIYSLAINNGGVIRATGVRSVNGRVMLVAEGGNVENSGSISAQNADGSGGSVLLSAGHNTKVPATLINSGDITARGERAGTKGGEVRLLGDHVGVFGRGSVDASGASGGGTALIGGDTRGENPLVQNAQATFISPDAQIRADALTRGNGGRVVVFANDTARIYGALSARGGAAGGHGGFIETSGRNFFDILLTPDVTAALGRGGLWLIDPNGIDIVAGGGNSGINAADPFAQAGAADATLGVNLILAALTGGASVSITTSGTGDGDINVTVPVDFNGRGDNSLTLSAHRDININTGASITDSDPLSVDKLNLTLTANSDNAGGGALTIDAAINTGGGNLSLAGDDLTLHASGSLNSGAGFITVTASAGLGLGLGAAPGDFAISGFELSAITTSGGLRLVTTGSGDLTVDGITATDSANVTGPLALEAGRNVNFSGGASSFNSLAVDAGTVINFSANVTAAGGQTYNDPIALLTDITLAGLDLTLALVTGNHHDLTLNGGSMTTLGGAVTDVKNFTTGPGGVTTISGGSLTTSGNQVFNNNLDLSSDTLLQGANLTVTSVNGNSHDLTLNFSGDTLIDGLNFSSVKNLTTGGGGATLLSGGTILTTGSQTYNDAVELQAATTLQGTDLTLGSVDGSGFDLTLSGSGIATLGGVVSAVANLKSDGGGSTALNGGTITTTGSQQYDDAVRLGVDTTLAAGVGVTFNGALDSAAGTLRSLTVNAPGTSFLGLVGGSDRLAALTTDRDGATVLANTINLNGSTATFNDAVLLGGNTTINEAGSGNVTFNNTVDSASGNNFSLTVNTPGGGNTVFNGAVGADSFGFFSDDFGLGSLTTDAAGATLLNGGIVNTLNNQTYDDAVTLGMDTTLHGVDVSFNGTLNSAAGTLRSLRVNASGVTRFNGVVGGVDRLAALTTDSSVGHTELGAALNLNGATTTFNDAVLLTAGVTIDQAGAGDVVFSGSVDSAVGNNHSLTVNTPGGGATVFEGSVGFDALAGLSDDDGLGGLTTDAAGVTRLNGGSIRTAGIQAYHDAVALGADTTLAGTDVSFLGALDSALGTLHSLIVNANGATRFNGAVGGSDRLLSITTDTAGRTEFGGASVNLDGATATTFNDQVLLTADATFSQIGVGDVAFNHTVDSASGNNFNLSVNTPGGGNTLFGGAVGSDALGVLSDNLGLSSLTTDAAGATAINGGSVRTLAAQTYGDAVRLGADTTLTGSDVAFNGTLDSALGTLRSLLVNASGVTRFLGAVGANDRIASLTTDLGGRTEINGGIINLNGSSASAFDDAVLLNASLTLDQSGSGDVTFGSTVDGASGVSAALTVNTAGGGNTTFGGSVGSDALGAASADAGLASLTTDGAGQTLLNGALVRTSGAQNHADQITLGADTTLEAGSVILNKVNGGGNDLTVKADAIGMTVGQAVTVARLTLQPITDGRDIDIGSGSGGLVIDQSELDLVTADVLQIGSINTGSIVVSAGITFNPVPVPTLHLVSGASIHEVRIDAGVSPSLTVNNLAVQSAGDVLLTGNNTINNFAANLTVNGRTLSLCNGVDLTIDTVDGLVGIVAGDGSAASSGTVNLFADHLSIAQQINAGKGRVALQQKTASRAIDLGTETAGKLSLTATELARVRAGTLKIGNGVSGSITISAALDFGVNDPSPKVRNLSLQSGGEIVEGSGGSIQVQGLALRSPSPLGAVLNNPNNDWLRLGADLSGPLVVTEIGGYASAGLPPNDLDGLTGVSASSFDLRAAALNALAAAAYIGVPIPRPTGLTLEFASPDTKAPGFDDPDLIWTSYLHLPNPPEDPGRKIRKVEEQSKWTTLPVSGSTAGPRSPQ